MYFLNVKNNIKSWLKIKRWLYQMMCMCISLLHLSLWRFWQKDTWDVTLPLSLPRIQSYSQLPPCRGPDRWWCHFPRYRRSSSSGISPYIRWPRSDSRARRTHKWSQRIRRTPSSIVAKGNMAPRHQFLFIE